VLDARPLAFPGHSERRVLVTFQDITARKQAEAAKDLRSEEELRRSEAFLAEGQRLSLTGSFSWKVATDEITWSEQLYRIYELEIGVPVTLELIRTRVHPEDISLIEKMKMVDQARDAADVVARLRALFSTGEFTFELLDLNEITREVIALSLSDLQRCRVVLQSELAEDLPAITGDRIQLQQVILNLLRNASDAMAGVHDRPRQLLIRTEPDDGNRVRVSVRDAGAGVDPQNMNKLFDAFYTTKSDGMGIGLSVSRSIIERHHGRLWAESNDGPGATFSFSIPRGPESVTGAVPERRRT